MNYLLERSVIYVSPVFQKLALVAVGVAVLTLSAKLSIPLMSVPLTFQAATVILMGFLMERKVAMASVLAYLSLGVLGLPVFASGAGFLYLLGPTGGYLLAFIPVIGFVSYAQKASWTNTYVSRLSVILLATALFFIFGVSWLAYGLQSLSLAIKVGFLPFAVTDVCKAIVLAGLIRQAR